MNPSQLRELERIAKGSKDKMLESSCFISIMTDHYERDPVCLMQFAMSLLMDKPLLLLVPVSKVVPTRVIKVATKICYYDPDSPESLKKATKDLAEFANALSDKKKSQ